MKREVQNRNHALGLCSGMCFSDFHMHRNCLGILSEGRLGISISKEIPSDVIAAGPRITALGSKDQESLEVFFLHDGW